MAGGPSPYLRPGLAQGPELLTVADQAALSDMLGRTINAIDVPLHAYREQMLA